MATEKTIEAEVRTGSGKGAARTLRRQGKVPAVIYGRGRAPAALQLDAVALERLLAKIRAASTIVDVTVTDQKPVKALIREIQRNPVRPIEILHVDLYEVHADEKISVEVPLVFTGTAEGVKNQNGVLELIMHELEIRVLPGDIPDKIEVDVSALMLGQSLHVSDLKLDKVEILTDQGITLCTVVAAKAEEVAPAATAEAAVTTEAVAEPELIRKPKASDEEEGDEKE
jgi:large subunit ribosomal protein L25